MKAWKRTEKRYPERKSQLLTGKLASILLSDWKMKIKMIFSKSRRKNSIWKAFRKGKTEFAAEKLNKIARNIDFQGS